LGILLFGLGLVFLLANFGLGSWIGWDRWWPLILIVIGVVIIVRRGRAEFTPPGGTGEPPLRAGAEAHGAPGLRRRLPLGGLILIGLGVAFILEDVLGGEALPALILIAIGGALLLRQLSAR
ncbi:MAG: LiaI-LiaF-like domain-containing protein, partial [Gemmatimonadales bacterium]